MHTCAHVPHAHERRGCLGIWILERGNERTGELIYIPKSLAVTKEQSGAGILEAVRHFRALPKRVERDDDGANGRDG